jgi:hypothetical protein
MEDESIDSWLFEKANLQITQIRHSTLEDYVCVCVRARHGYVFVSVVLSFILLNQ